MRGRHTCRIPRTRGDGPEAEDRDVIVIQDSPHPRGWTLDSVQEQAVELGFPAPAGMDPRRPSNTWNGPGIPRTRGDGPAPFCGKNAENPDSPHPRGWTARCRGPGCAARGFPAPAGMDPGLAIRLVELCGIPRTRGDGPGTFLRRLPRAPDSPHPRGFPAPAGMDPREPASGTPLRRIPRTRGDGPARATGGRSSPTRTRGSRVLAGRRGRLPSNGWR